MSSFSVLEKHYPKIFVVSSSYKVLSDFCIIPLLISLVRDSCAIEHYSDNIIIRK